MKKLLVPLFVVASTSFAFADSAPVAGIFTPLGNIVALPAASNSNFGAVAQVNRNINSSIALNLARLNQFAGNGGSNTFLGAQVNYGVTNSLAVNALNVRQTAP